MTFKTETEYTHTSFDLLREVASYVCVGACILGPTDSWSRDQAVIGGNMVRLFKLLSAFLDQTNQRRRETGDILARLAFETMVNIRYLVKKFSPELINEYVRHSLRHERKLRDKIQANINQRGGAEQDIERRMLNSIERTALAAGISLDSVDSKDRSNWGGNIFQRAKYVGLSEAYFAAFAGMSQYVHGSWHDIYSNHLEIDKTDVSRFVPSLEWRRPRPQILLALGHLAIDTIQDAVLFLGGEYALGQLSRKLADLNARIMLVDEAHESYLSKESSPKT
jgi:hypothetical protein